MSKKMGKDIICDGCGSKNENWRRKCRNCQAALKMTRLG